MPTHLNLHSIKERLLQRTCEVSLPPKLTRGSKKQQFGWWNEVCSAENHCWERSTFWSLWPVCSSHLQQLMPQFSCRSAGLICLSVLVHRFLMGSIATCSSFYCFRCVITGIPDFCLVCTEWKIADAATNFRQVCRSKICWQLPAPFALVASSE